MLTATSTEIVCPRGSRTESPLVIDVARLRESEQRQDEVATVTKFKAPELLAEFNRSWRELNEWVVQLTAERNTAQKAADNRKAVLLLGEVASILKEKGVASTADTREAVITLDAEYQQLVDVVDQIEAVIEFLKGKAKSFENAYTSVKKILGEDSFAPPGNNPNLSGGTNAPPTRPGFGRSTYGR